MSESEWNPVVKPCGREGAWGLSLRFVCPGCNSNHIIHTGGTERPQWDWNGDYERPTFSPSYFITTPGAVCHSFIREGQIQYLDDCHHKLAGQTVALPRIDYPREALSYLTSED